MDVLISGAGIAGLTLAWHLERMGHRPVVVERASALRTGGYVVDFWGAGYTVAERMGLIPEVNARGYKVREVRFVGADGRRVGGFGTDAFSRVTGDRFISLQRGALAEAIHAALGGRVEIRFGDRVTGLDDQGGGVEARFERAAAQRFDVVVGADGLHSGVRALAFGEEARFERFLGYTVAAFETKGYRPRDELVYVSYALPDRQAARFAERGDMTLFLMIMAEDEDAPAVGGDPRALLHARFDGAGWECREIMAAMDAAPELYFDRVSQIEMARWSRGRIALVGDAGACQSLLAGEGTSLAMTSAYVLAGELDRAADPAAAFAAWEARLRPLIEQKQTSARRFAGAFAPRTRFGLAFRNLVTRAMALPFVAELVIGRDLRDDIVLPDFGGVAPGAAP